MTTVIKLVDSLKSIVENGPNPSLEIRTNAVRQRTIARELIETPDVKDVVQRIPNWEIRLSSLRMALDTYWGSSNYPFSHLRPDKHADAIEFIGRFVSWLNEAVEVSPRDDGFDTGLSPVQLKIARNDAVIQGRFEILERISVDLLHHTITFDKHTWTVNVKAAELFDMICEQWPKPVSVSKQIPGLKSTQAVKNSLPDRRLKNILVSDRTGATIDLSNVPPIST